MHSAPLRSTRRAFLKSASLAGLSVWGGRNLFLDDARAQTGTETIEKSYPSHGPDNNWLQNSRELINKMIMPPPTGARVNDQICRSRRLENVFYLDLGKHAVLIDTGYHHQVNHHLDNFKELGCDLGKVVAILGTHFHVDHTAGVKRARERLGVPLVMHPRSVEPVSTGDLLVTAAVIPELDGWKFEYPASPVDHTVDDGDVIAIGEERIAVRHIPGHTPDSLGYIWRGHFFTGDAVFGMGLIGWANERWFSNYTDHKQTMQRLVAKPPEAEQFYAAHGPDLPYASSIPETCLKTLGRLLRNDADPCNHTPRVRRRKAEEPTRVLKLPA